MESFTEKWIEAQSASFIESKKDGDSKYYLEALIVPFDKISRNGVKYNKKSIEETHKGLIGKPLNHNHITTGATVLPRGKWVETWLEDDGMHGKAEVFNTDYNKDYIDWLKADKSPRVSLQVTGDARQMKEEVTGRYYREATIKDWLEASTVTIPGFDSAKANFELAIAECFGDSCSVDNSFEEAAMKDIEEYIDELLKKHMSEKDIIKAVAKKYKISKKDAEDIIGEELNNSHDNFFEMLESIRTVYTEIDDKYQNPDGTFKLMKAPGEDKESKFGGCVKYMMSKGKSQESAEKICGYIAKNK
jgi:hypothetical protein